MSVTLQSILNDTDLKQIPLNIRNRIDIVLESKCKSLDLEKQRFQLVDKDYNDLKIKYEYNSDLINRYKSHLAQLEDDLHNARKELCDSNHQKDCLNVELKNQNLEINSKDEQIKRLNELVKLKNEDARELSEKYSKLQVELEETRKKNNNSSNKVEEERLIGILAEKDKLCELQCNYFRDEFNRVTEEFHEKSSKFNSLSSEFTNYKNETEIKLNDLNKENSSFKNQITFLKNQIDKKDDQINDLAVKLKEMNQHQDLLKEQYDIEKKQHSDLLNYYKKVNDQNQITQNEILSQIKALEENHELKEKQLEQNIAKLANDNHQLLEEIRFKEEVILDLKTKIEELKSQILTLNQKEVDNAVNQFYPTSNTISKLFENNMPLSTVYSKYEELQSKCQNLVEENEELKLRIQEMIAESESNAPLIYYKTQEVKKAHAEIEEYKMQLSKISSDLGNSFSEIDNYNKTNNYLKRELKRYEKSNIDLTRQVQCLLQSVHELRGNFISSKFLVDDEYLAKENEYDRSISLNLVTFKNIEEMHENNKKLLGDLRALNDQLEELKDTNQVKDDESFKKHLDELLLEIESLKEENRHKQEILSEMMAERESKLNTSKLDSGSKDKQGSTSSLFKITSRAYLEDKVADLANKLDAKVEEFNSFKQEAKDQESKLREEISKYQQQITNYQNEISKLTVKLDTVNENNKVLDATLNRYNKETNLVKERNAKLEEQRKMLKERIGTFESKKNELVSKLEEMKKDLDTKTNLINILEKQNTQVKCENEIIKSNLKEMKNELQEVRNEALQLKTDSKINTVRSECDLKSKIQILELTNGNLQSSNQALTAELNELNNKITEKDKQFNMKIIEMKKKILEITNKNTMVEREKDSLVKQLKDYRDKLVEIEQTDDSKNATARIVKAQMDLKKQLEERNGKIVFLSNEKEKLISMLNAKDQELQKQNKLKVEYELQVQERMTKVRKEADAALLKEKLLKSRVENLLADNEKKVEELNATKLELSATKEELLKNQLHNQYKLKQQQMQSKTDAYQQQQQASNQPTTLTPTTAKSVIAKINPTVISRSQIQSTTGNTSLSTIPQATITPTTQNPTAYVIPTSLTNLEVSSAENISSNISSSTTASLTSSFSMPSTSSNLLSSSNQDQQRHSFSMPSTTGTGMQLKRQRITLSDYKEMNKKQKSESSFPSTSSTSSQTKPDNTTLFGKKNQIEQATCSSSSINDQEMLPVPEESKTSQEQKSTKTESDTVETSKQEEQEEKEAETEETKNEQQHQQIVEQMENNEIINQEADGNSLGLEASNTESQDKPQQARDSPTSNLVNTEEIEEDNDNLEEGEEEDDEEGDEEDNNNELDEDNEEDYSANEENDAQMSDNDDEEDFENENSELDDEEENSNQGMNQDSNTQEHGDRNSSDIICISDGEDENANDQQLNQQSLNAQFGQQQFNQQQFDQQQFDQQQFNQQQFEQQQFNPHFEQEMDTSRKDAEFNPDSEQQQQQQQQQMLSNEADNAASSLNDYLANESSQNQNYPDSANQLEQAKMNVESIDQSYLRMPTLTELNRVTPFSVQKDEPADCNLIIDEEQPIESETHFIETTDSNSLTSNLNTLASVTEQQAQQQEQLNMPRLSLLTNPESVVQEEENSNPQSQQIDQTKTLDTNQQSSSTITASTSNQQKKSRLKRPTLRLNVNEQKKNQEKPE